LGQDASAVAAGSIALGYVANAGGYNSIAIGYNTKTGAVDSYGALMNNAISIGTYSNAGGGNSIAIGVNAHTHLNNSIAIGGNSYASTDSTVAIGVNANSGALSVAIGSSTIAANTAVALGYGAKAAKIGSTAIGHNANVNGLYYSTALGYGANVYGNNSTALGFFAGTASADENCMQLGNASSLATLRCRVSLTVTSDERDKADVTPIENSLAFVKRLEPISYKDNQREKYISYQETLAGVTGEEGGELSEKEKLEKLSPEERAFCEAEIEKYRKYGMAEYDREAHAAGTKKGARTRAGVSAQKTVEALEAVYGTADVANIVNDNLHDVEEELPEGVESKLTVAYDRFVPFLIGAVRELAERVEALEGGAL
jgi:hypothetical protein